MHIYHLHMGLLLLIKHYIIMEMHTKDFSFIHLKQILLN